MGGRLKFWQPCDECRVLRKVFMGQKTQGPFCGTVFAFGDSVIPSDLGEFHGGTKV